MPAPELLGQLSTAQELAYTLVESADAEACRTPYHPELSPLGWYLGYCAFLEAWWLRREVLGETQFSDTVSEPMQAMAPREAAQEVARGHYRVGAADPDRACDNELPPQAVQLDAYRIATWPVANGEYLTFVQAGGYTEDAPWDAEGRTWRDANSVRSPADWRQDGAGHWYGVGVNGPYALTADTPLSGINHHQARAYAAWAATRGGALAGATGACPISATCSPACAWSCRRSKAQAARSRA